VVCSSPPPCGLALGCYAFPFAARFISGLSMPLVVVEIGLAERAAGGAVQRSRVPATGRAAQDHRSPGQPLEATACALSAISSLC